MSGVSFRLTKIAPKVVTAYGNRFCSAALPTDLPILYLTNFYTNLPHQKLINEGIKNIPEFDGLPTKTLISAINHVKLENGWPKILFCCEPVMGDNPKSITYKNYHLTPEERYKNLLAYYKRLGMTNTIESFGTLHDHLWDDGRIEDRRRFRFMQYGEF